jgi:hypothetical protein
MRSKNDVLLFSYLCCLVVIERSRRKLMRFGDRQVCWPGGWARFRLYHLVMLVKVPPQRMPRHLWAIAQLTWLLLRTEL